MGESACDGEALLLSAREFLRLVMDAFPSSEFHNLYGPTETNVCTHYPVPRPIPEDMSDLPIGDACPNMEAFAEITRRARETIWLTPEPRYSWGLGRCDLPAYAEYCDRVRVVRDLSGLESTTNEMAGELIGR